MLINLALKARKVSKISSGKFWLCVVRNPQFLCGMKQVESQTGVGRPCGGLLPVRQCSVVAANPAPRALKKIGGRDYEGCG